jgi:hypothetical protein
LAGAYVGDPHSRLHPGKRHHFLELTHPIAGVFSGECVADDRGDRPVRLWEAVLLTRTAAGGE